MMNKRVFVLGAYDPVLLNIKLPVSQLKENGGKFVTSYFSFSRVLFQSIRKTLITGNLLHVNFMIVTPSNYLSYFQQSTLDTSTVQLAIFKDKELLEYIPSSFAIKQINQTHLQKMISFRLDLPPGKYTGKLGITNCIPGQPSLNSTAFHFEVR